MTGSTEIALRLVPRDPIVARDGRPFAAGMRMRSLDWPLPSVTAGSLRTLLGKADGGFHGEEARQRIANLQQVTLRGPFPLIADGPEDQSVQPYFPAPADLVVSRNPNGTADDPQFPVHPLRPEEMPAGSGCNLPHSSLQPAMLNSDVDNFKPVHVPEFWSLDTLARWLSDPDGRTFLAGESHWPEGFLNAPAKDRRMHVQMDYAAGAGAEGMLFQSVSLDLERFARSGRQQPIPDGRSEKWAGWSEPVSLVMRVSSAHFQHHLNGLGELHPLGGERRLVYWQSTPDSSPVDPFACPKQIREALGRVQSAKRGVRLVLATPAIFQQGWRPDGFTEDGNGQLVGVINGVRLKLVSACIGRWQPVSGWSLAAPRGPKPVRRMVPAGSVYFFETDDDATPLAEHWLKSVCSEGADDPADDGQAHRDGFGLATWGIWQRFEPGSNTIQ